MDQKVCETSTALATANVDVKCLFILVLDYHTLLPNCTFSILLSIHSVCTLAFLLYYCPSCQSGSWYWCYSSMAFRNDEVDPETASEQEILSARI